MKEVKAVKIEFMTKTTEEWNTIFQRKQDVINEAIDVYLELKKLSENSDTSFFRWAFLAFYGMGQHHYNEKRERFFDQFKVEYRYPVVIRDIVNVINGDKESSYYYSFVTKMLNMKYETLYPIYDTRIAKNVFHCDTKTEMDLNGKEECYKKIKELYDSIDDSDPAIVAFKNQFPKAKSLGKMRLLDFILYNTVE